MPEGDDDIPELIARVRKRDEGAARALIDRLGPLIAKIIGGHSVLRDEAEDLAQDIFFNVFRSIETWRGDGPLEHWVARIARCTCIDRLRRKKARPEQRIPDLTPGEIELLEASQSTQPNSDSQAEDALNLLEKILNTLPPADAWLLRQVELEQRTVADVASEAGWTNGATHIRLFRARSRLKRAFLKHHET